MIVVAHSSSSNRNRKSGREQVLSWEGLASKTPPRSEEDRSRATEGGSKLVPEDLEEEEEEGRRLEVPMSAAISLHLKTHCSLLWKLSLPLPEWSLVLPGVLCN